MRLHPVQQLEDFMIQTTGSDELAGRPALYGALPDQQSASAVSWGAILAGAAAAAALSLILLLLGTGLGLSSASPWAGRGASATTLGVSTILWLTFTQLAASGMGGYLAGRLRTRWISVHTDEVYFRDTAHGFLAWAVASLVTAALLTTTIGAIVSGGAQAAGSVASGAATAATATAAGGAAAATRGAGNSGTSDSSAYFIDSLFRRSAGAPAPAADGSAASPGAATAAPQAGPAPTAEVARIFANSLRSGNLPANDVQYVGQLVSQRTGLSQQEAEKRVNDTYAAAQARLKDAEDKAREAADQARKASAYAALWMFISLLIGAFVASLGATFGGRRRDL
jgi:hypothetical protein